MTSMYEHFMNVRREQVDRTLAEQRERRRSLDQQLAELSAYTLQVADVLMPADRDWLHLPRVEVELYDPDRRRFR